MPDTAWRNILLVGAGRGAIAQRLRAGLERHIRLHELPWRVQMEPDGLISASFRYIPGVLAVVGYLRQSERAAEAAAQGVLLASCGGGALQGLPAAWVSVPPDEIGRLGANHLLDAGYRHLACWDLAGISQANDRCAAFRARAAELGLAVTTLTRARTEGELAETLRTLPAGTGLFTHQDKVADWLRGICVRAGIAIPDHLGLLGVDDHAEVCEASAPTLSSIRLPWDAVGEALALCIHRLSQGVLPERAGSDLRPVGVHQRQSTARSWRRQDPLERAAGLIAAKPGTSIDAACRTAGLDERTFQRRFRAAYGTSARDWRSRRRLERAVELLLTTDLTQAEVARRSGLGTRQALHAACRRMHGMPPDALRREAQGPAP